MAEELCMTQEEIGRFWKARSHSARTCLSFGDRHDWCPKVTKRLNGECALCLRLTDFRKQGEGKV